ncbi:MAG: rubredoxin [Tepidanaerobacteraceae bacterium]|jgi:rubredoxin|nr:rubredoxin [Tepidanaerobacteraceae bacterium]
MIKWQCSVCGYIHDGDEAPDKCPKCGAPKEKFIKMEEQAASLVERARFSNNLHMELLTLMERAKEICDKGIKDELDPGCVAVFKTSMAAAHEVQQKVKAELKTHMNKGKWG